MHGEVHKVDVRRHRRSEEVEVDESNELQAIMALDDVGIEASINKKDQVVVKKKDLKTSGQSGQHGL